MKQASNNSAFRDLVTIAGACRQGGLKPVQPEEEESPMPKVYVSTAHAGAEAGSFASLPRLLPGTGHALTVVA